MMKEKISEYVDGRVGKEEIERDFRETPEDRIYYEQLLAIKDILGDMQVSAPDISASVIAKSTKRLLNIRFVYTLSLVAVVVISALLIKSFSFKPQMKVGTVQTPDSGMRSFSANSAIPSIDVTISKDSEKDVLNILKANGTVVSVENPELEPSETTPSTILTPAKIITFKLNPNNLSAIENSIKTIKGATITIPTLENSSEEIEVVIRLIEH